MRLRFCTCACSSWLLIGRVGICICFGRFCKCFCQRVKCFRQLGKRFCGSCQHS